ncbi:PREDICTED: nucleolin-like [Camelina sativa]|uniref:Nucleolin-like n=1 Tax=Camelina sativa TaxID=90675 RepID=A0ABM0VYT6_CAMSA|nr:PREDICTED: nucleolin-like [Camelina sativa]
MVRGEKSLNSISHNLPGIFNRQEEVEEITLQAAPATTLKVNKKRKAKKVARRSSTRSKKVAAQYDEVEDVTPQAMSEDEKEDSEKGNDKDVTPEADQTEKAMSEDEKEDSEKGNDKDVTPEADQTEKAMSEDEKEDSEKGNDKDVTPEAAQTEKAMSEDEKEDSEIEGEACLTGQEQQEDEEEAANMEEDGVGIGQDNAIPSNTDERSQVPEERVKERKKRGPTKMRKVAENPNENVSVTFNDFGDHVGPCSITLSSFLNVLVREHVPVTLSDWRKVDAVTKQAMGGLTCKKNGIKLLFSSKSEISEGLEVKAIVKLWNSWVRSKTNAAFTEISNNYRNMRQNQIPHTTSRKGMLRLVDDMEQIQSLDSQMDSTSTADNIREDVVGKILGKDKPG